MALDQAWRVAQDGVDKAGNQVGVPLPERYRRNTGQVSKLTRFIRRNAALFKKAGLL